MTTEVPWLSAQEEHLWRAWSRLNNELSARLQRDLQHDAQLSLSDYEVLVHLTDTSEGRLRVSDLARLLQWGLSRVSHHVTRMQGRGLVERVVCVEDGRGAFVVVTPAGRVAIEQAAPGHVAAVRRLAIDALDPEEVATLSGVFDKMLARLEEIEVDATKTSPGPAIL
ncbi:MAG: MarR family winged helix-turn-helix transcriptional regulator [Nocardioides sp.]